MAIRLLMMLLVITAVAAPLCVSEAAAQALPILRGGMHQENVQGEPYQLQRDLKMSSKKNMGMGKSSSKSSKSGKGKGRGWSYGRHSRQPRTRPPILDLVDLYQLRRTTPVPTWTPPDEESSIVPQPAPPATLAPVIGTAAPPPPQQQPTTTVSPTLSPTIPKTAPPTRDISPPPTWGDTPQPTAERTLQRTNNVFTRVEARQAELDCQLTEGGLFGMPSDTSSVYQVEFLYQIYVAAGTTEAVLRSQVAPLLDEGVTELILPVFFDCGNNRRSRFLQSTGTIDGISSRPEDEIVFFGLPCNGDSKEGSDCYVVKGYVSVFASGFRTQQDLEDFVLPEIRKILQGSALSTLIPEVTGAQNLNDDLSPMEPTTPTSGSPSAPSPTPPVDPNVPSTTQSPADDETPTAQPANSTEPPANRPSPIPPTTPEVPTNVETRSVEDESFLDKMEWWGWILLVGGGLIVVSAVLTFIMNRNRPSSRPPGQPMRSDEDKDTQDNSAAYKPPGDDNYNSLKKSAAVDSNVGRSQVAPTTSDRDIGRFQTTPAENGNAGRYQTASAAAAPAAAPAAASAAAAAAAAIAARRQPAPAASTGSTRYQHPPPAAAPATRYQPPPAATDVGGFQETPASRELGQLGSVDEAESYHHSVAYAPENQPPPTQHRYQQQQQQQQQDPHEEVSEYEEYIEEEYIEEGTGTGSGEYDDYEEEYVEEIHNEEADASYETYEEEEEVFIEDHS